MQCERSSVASQKVTFCKALIFVSSGDAGTINDLRVRSPVADIAVCLLDIAHGDVDVLVDRAIFVEQAV